MRETCGYFVLVRDGNSSGNVGCFLVLALTNNAGYLLGTTTWVCGGGELREGERRIGVGARGEQLSRPPSPIQEFRLDP